MTDGARYVQPRYDVTFFASVRHGRLDEVVQWIEAAPELVSQCDYDGRTPLHIARTGAMAQVIMNASLERGGRVLMTRDRTGETPLIAAMRDLTSDSESLARILLVNGASLTDADNAGYTCVHWAAAAQCTQDGTGYALNVLRVMQAHDPGAFALAAQATSNDGETPLHLCDGFERAWCVEPLEAIARLLEEAGVSRDAVDKCGRTAGECFGATLASARRRQKVMEEELLAARVAACAVTA